VCEIRNVHKILVGKPEWKRSLVKPRGRWMDNIKMDVWEGVDGPIWLRIGTSDRLL
jgi:hypothetical protein